MTHVPFESLRSRDWLAVLVAATVWCVALVLSWHGTLIGDEWVHYHQIARFLSGDHSVMVEYLTTLPGFHWTVTGLMWLVDSSSLRGARLVNAGFGLATVFVFYCVRRRVNPRDALASTLQFAVFPLLLPFYFLVYTDGLSLLLVLSATLACITRRNVSAGILLVLAMLVRQNNVVWVAFLATWAMLCVVRESGLDRRSLARLARVEWPYAGAVVAFLCYWWWHGTISYSSSQAPMHPDVSLHVGNPFLFLFIVALMLPLQTFAGVREFVLLASRRPAWWLLPVVLVVAFLVWFRVDHPYNHIALDQNVRNALLIQTQQHVWVSIGFCLVAVLAACALVGKRWNHPNAWLLLPFASVALAGSWLIEPRYSFIPLTVLLVLRRRGSPGAERVTTALWAAIAVYLLIGIFDQRFMV